MVALCRCREIPAPAVSSPSSGAGGGRVVAALWPVPLQGVLGRLVQPAAAQLPAPTRPGEVRGGERSAEGSAAPSNPGATLLLVGFSFGVGTAVHVEGVRPSVAGRPSRLRP